MTDEREPLAYEQAVEMLLPGRRIHTFRSPGGGILLGCDVNRKDILKILKHGSPELAGEQAAAMNHRIVAQDHGYIFIETKPLEKEEPAK